MSHNRKRWQISLPELRRMGSRSSWDVVAPADNSRAGGLLRPPVSSAQLNFSTFGDLSSLPATPENLVPRMSELSAIGKLTSG